MAWALVNNVEMEIEVGHWEGEGMGQHYVIEAVNAIPGTIVNLIAYNGTDPYTPPEGTRVAEVPDTAKVGDTGY